MLILEYGTEYDYRILKWGRYYINKTFRNKLNFEYDND
jgi:hypothetical protein